MKGLGIIFVVVGHTSYSPVHNFVYLFHLAVFYFVAGYFFKDKYIDDKLLFLWKKIKSLWFPLIGYGIVFMLLHNLFSELIFIILRPAICTHDKTIWIVLKILYLRHYGAIVGCIVVSEKSFYRFLLVHDWSLDF